MFFEKAISRKCRLCCQLFIIPKNFEEDEGTCNSCFKIPSDIDKHGKLHVIWKDNSQYRVFTNLWRSFSQEIMNKEDLIGKYGYIDVKNITVKLHKLLILFEMKENPQVALHLHCLTSDSNVNMQNIYLVAMLLNTL